MKGIIAKVGLQRVIAFSALVVLVVIFSAFGNGFATWPTILNVAKISYFIGFLAIGLTFVFAAGGMDISTGTGMSCIGLIGGVIFKNTGNMILTLAVMILSGLILGIINGYLIAYMKIGPFIVTMAMQMITRGFGSIASNVQSQNFPNTGAPGGWYKSIFLFNPGGLPQTMAGGLPTGLIVLLIFAVVMSLILTKTKIGRYTLAIGSNKEAARLSGVKTEKWELLTYVISGLTAGLAAIAYAASYTSFVPGANDGWEMQAIAGMVIGGTSMAGGIASVSGTIIGVLIMSVLKAGLPTVGLQPHYQLLFTGIILIVAVYADVLSHRKKN